MADEEDNVIIEDRSMAMEDVKESSMEEDINRRNNGKSIRRCI